MKVVHNGRVKSPNFSLLKTVRQMDETEYDDLEFNPENEQWSARNIAVTQYQVEKK